MQKLRRLNFFDRHVVRREGSDVHPGIQRLSVSCACGGSQHLWLGERGGSVRRLDRQFTLSSPLQLFDRELLDLQLADDRQLLVALGCDAVGRGQASSSSSGGGASRYFYKIIDAKRTHESSGASTAASVILLSHRIAPQQRGAAEHRGTCLAVSSGLQILAVGTESGVVYVFRARDLAQEKPAPLVIMEEGEVPVTGVHFLEQQYGKGRRTVLFICNANSVRSWIVQVQGTDRDDTQEVRQLNVDCTGGSAECCACVFPTTNALLVAKGDAIYAFDPDEGNMSAMPLEGDKLILQRFKSYFVSVSSEGGMSSSALGGVGGSSIVAATPSSMPKQNVIVCLAYPHMRFIAYSSQFTDVTHVVPGMGGIFVLSRGGADGNTVLFELREKELPEQLDVLLKKRMFEWAAEVGLQCGAPAETICDIYRQHGDALFEKRAYDQALAVYTKTVDLGLPLEPSYIVECYLDVQRIGHVAKYLKRLHERDMAEREHTALLLKCYTKLKDFSTLEEFLETTPVSQYDPSTAIEVLEAAGYYGLAVDVALKVQRHDDYVRISLEHFKHFTKIVEFLRNLPPLEAGRILISHGRLLVQHAPSETVDLLRELCGLKTATAGAGLAALGGAGANAAQPPSVDEFLPIFVDDLPQLENLLRSILLTPDGPLPNAGAERLFPTLLELLVRSHWELSQKALATDSTAQDPMLCDLHREILRLIRQYPGEDAMASTLHVCHSYGFVDGFFYAAKQLGRFQLVMSWCFEQRDAKRLLQLCKECGSDDPSLWVQALSFLAADDSADHIEEISEVLRHIELSDLMPLLMVVETLSQNPRLSISVVRPYLQGQFKKLTESVETSRGKTRQDRQEIERMQQEILALRTQAQVFQNTKCYLCGLTLEVPAVHFFCGHSYHSYCMPADSNCPKCSSEALPKITLKEQREAQARNTEDFFKYLQGGGGEGGVQAISEWCKFGAFDAGNIVVSQVEHDS